MQDKLYRESEYKSLCKMRGVDEIEYLSEDELRLYTRQQTLSEISSVRPGQYAKLDNFKYVCCGGGFYSKGEEMCKHHGFYLDGEERNV